MEEEAVEEEDGLRRRSLTANVVLLRLARDHPNPSIGCGLEYLDASFPPFLAAP